MHKKTHLPNHRAITAVYIRNFVFGVEDSLVSTVGLLSGVAITNTPERTVFLSGVVLICVEAFSMAVGTYLSQESADEYEVGRESDGKRAFFGAAIMFLSYLLSGIIPLFPYLILATRPAFILSIGLALASLLILGMISGNLAGTKILRTGLRMLLIGGITVILGVVVGAVVNQI